MNKLVAVTAIAVLLGLALVALMFGGTIAGSTKGSVNTNGSKESQVPSTNLASGNNSNSFYMAMNIIPTIRLVPLGGNANFTVVLYSGGDLTGGYSLSAAPLSGFSFEFDAATVDLSQAGPHAEALRISSSSEASPGTYQVTIAATGPKGVANQTFDFQVQRNLILLGFAPHPQFLNITVKAGDTVTWMSLQGLMSDDNYNTHQLVFSTDNLASPSLLLYETWSHTFTQPGIYRYYDSAADRTITGEVIVTP